ncbi:hypothetical protein B0J14DRAFT_654264 [Halenospora varia]|nr:hypothetical protein B0J14DRAFT_654264 [Halenospora varia]
MKNTVILTMLASLATAYALPVAVAREIRQVVGRGMPEQNAKATEISVRQSNDDNVQYPNHFLRQNQAYYARHSMEITMDTSNTVAEDQEFKVRNPWGWLDY